MRNPKQKQKTGNEDRKEQRKTNRSEQSHQTISHAVKKAIQNYGIIENRTSNCTISQECEIASELRHRLGPIEFNLKEISRQTNRTDNSIAN